MKKKLHPTQEKLLELLIDNIDNPLTIRELQDLLGASSTSVVAHHIEQLERNGYLKRNPSNPKDYQILSNPEKPVTYLNLYGLAQCGPNGSILDGDPIDRIPVATKLLAFPSSDAFMVRARGDSMEPKISNGDYVIAKRTNAPQNNSIVVCVNNGEALIKKVKMDNGRIILASLNSTKYDPFLASEDDFRVEGEVRNVISHT